MNPYQHLTTGERERIFVMHEQGETLEVIGRELKRSPSTISESYLEIHNMAYTLLLKQHVYTQPANKNVAENEYLRILRFLMSLNIFSLKNSGPQKKLINA